MGGSGYSKTEPNQVKNSRGGAERQKRKNKQKRLLKMVVEEYDDDRAIEKEFESGQCQNYQTAPLESLREHGYREGCWHIYLSRKYDDTVPYTFEAYKRNNSAWDREQYLFALVMGVAGTAIASGLVYFLGWLVGWVVTGFRQH